MSVRFTLVSSLTLGLLFACSSGTGSHASGSGGTGSGGADASGGAPGAGGTTSTGGTNASTAVSGSGGATSTGGASVSGGTTGKGGSGGGSTGYGGASGSGGIASKGGDSGAAGTTGSGGATGKGGSPGSGGATRTGGATGSGVGSGGATGASTGGCTRDILQVAVGSYLAALAAGSSSGMKLTTSATYTENGSRVGFAAGLWATPLTPDLTMSLLDVTLCQTYTEVIAASAPHPYVLGARLAVQASSGQISAVTVIATDCDDWGFNAATYLKEAKAEQTNTAAGSGWGPVDPADQYSRDELLAGGKAYFAYWGDKTVTVPWGYPCCRTEGGMVTNPDPKPNKSSTCSVGVPDQNIPPITDQLADVDYGMVVDFLNMPGPDSHWFRFTKSTDMRYVHTLTVCYLNGKWSCPGTQPTGTN